LKHQTRTTVAVGHLTNLGAATIS